MTKHFTVGLIFPELVDFGAMCWGAFDAAARHNANAICFQGNPLQSPIGFNAQSNILYDFIHDHTPLDGLVVWTGWFGQFVGTDASTHILKRFAPLPIVSISERIPGLPCILGDNTRSIFDIVDHLVGVHGYRRIAFVNGPLKHVESAERYRAYQAALASHGIPFDPGLVVREQFTHDAGVKAAHHLLDQHSTILDAVITSDDFVALGVIDGLAAHGLSVPEDIAVTGFDDTPYARASIPPLTTVRQSTYDQGYRGVELLLAQLAGEATPDEVTLPMQLAIRQSCGCSSPVVLRAVSSTTPAADTWGDLAPHRQHILQSIQAAMPATSNDIEPNDVTRLVEAFIAEMTGAATIPFMDILEDTLRGMMDANADIFTCQDVISAMRQTVLPMLTNRAAIVLATNLWGQARVLIGEMALRIRAQRHLTSDLRARLLREIGQELITTFDLEGLMTLLTQQIPRLGIETYALALYDLRFQAAIDDVPQWAYLMTEPGHNAPADPRRFPAHRLAVDHLLSRPDPIHLILEPLYFRERQLGYVLFEPGPRDGAVYEGLRGYLTTAVYGALLFQRNLELYEQAVAARATAEKADKLKTQLLANVSHDLRTPLNVIMGYAQAALADPAPYGIPLPSALTHDLQHISTNAEYLLRIINDLLDLSRAEINELDLHLKLVEPRALLQAVFDDMLESIAGSQAVTWRLAIPAGLPLIQADPDRLRQILFNLLSNAQKYTQRGWVTLGAEVEPPYLHLWVADTGEGISTENQERIFEPFETAHHHGQGIGLGLSIVRRLVALHRGTISLESAPDQGSTFHVYLPLPNLSGVHSPPQATGQDTLLVLSTQADPAPTVTALADQQGWTVLLVRSAADLDAVFATETHRYVALAWDAGLAGAGDWGLLRQMRTHSKLASLPFLLFYQGATAANDVQRAAQVTQIMLKPLGDRQLLDAIASLLPGQSSRPILAVDDDPQTLAFYERLVLSTLPGQTIITADGGQAAIDALEHSLPPALVILDLVMPDVDGFDVLDHLRTHESTRHVPVLILSGKLLTFEDVRRLNQQHVLLHTKDTLDDAELEGVLSKLVQNGLDQDRRTSELVKLAVAYINQHYAHTISREEICQVLGISENYLSRIFREELGLTPVDYINRYRVSLARNLLLETDTAITTVAQQVGFDDSAYFSRVFKRYTGQSPRAFRQNTPPP